MAIADRLTRWLGHRIALRAGGWEGERPDVAVFEREILPGLRLMQIGELVAATGLSPHYVSLIRLGKRVPHPRHWYAGGGYPNADGFGLGWYGERDVPGLYRSITPAWGDRNLRELAGGIESPISC